MSLVRPETPSTLCTAGETFRLSAYLQISALVNLSIWMLLLLPGFLAQKGWSSQRIGWAMGSYFSVYLLVQILAGQIAERYGNTTTALIGASLGIMAGLNYLLAVKWANFIFVARTLHGSGVAMVTAGALFHMVDSVPSHLKGRMIGYFGLPGFVMLAGGPLLAEVLEKYGGICGPFVAITVIFGGIFWLVRRLPAYFQRQDFHAESFVHGFRQNFSKLKVILAYSLVFGFCFSVWQSFLAPAVNSIGVGAVSSFGFGYGTGAVVTRLGISQRLETERRRIVAIAGLIVYGACLAFIPHVLNVWQLGILGFLSGMGHGVYYPALTSIAAERFHSSGTGTAMSLYISASSLGLFAGPLFWGFLADRIGYGWVFTGAGATLAGATMLFIFLETRGQ